MKYCKECVTPETRPRLGFDDNGVCNACSHAKVKQNIDWVKRKQELVEIANKYKTNKHYDCIIPVSGGKDSHYQIYYAKNILGLNPLCVTFMPAMPTKEGDVNRRNISVSLGVDHHIVTPDPETHRKLCRIMFLEHGNPFLPWIMGIFSAASQLAVEKNIPLAIYGENGESEYGGSTEAKLLDESGIVLRMKSDRHNWKNPDKWHEYDIPEKSLIPYQLPDSEMVKKVGIKRLFLGDFTPWNNNHNLYHTMNIVGGFSLLPRRTTGTYTHGASIDDDVDEIYLWFLWVKFGFGRASKSASPDIREGKLTRDGAIELVRLYDGEFPWHIFDGFLDYLQITEKEFWDVVKRFIGDEENIEREKQEAIDLGTPEEKIPKRTIAWIKISEHKWKHAGTIHGEDRFLEIPMKRPKEQEFY